MYQFPTEWADEIVAESAKAEYQNAEIELRDASLLTNKSYSVATNTWTYAGDSLLYSGQARIIAPRWGSDLGTSDGTNAFTETTIRVQLPYQAVGRVKKGVKMMVTACTRNPSLVGRAFVATSDFQGSMAASRTLQFKLDGDAVVDGG